jgi:hypothetical protein
VSPTKKKVNKIKKQREKDVAGANDGREKELIEKTT